MSRYADWKAPRYDGALLLWPDAARLLSGTRANELSLSNSDTKLLDLPLSALRGLTRQALLGDTAAAGAGPVIATGHQIEMYHPGVWAKNVLIETLVRRAGGTALHVAVDTDSPKHLELRGPHFVMPVSDDPALFDAAWSGRVKAPSAGHVRALRGAFEAAAAGWPFAPMTGPFFDALSRSRHAMLPATVLEATAAVDRALGLGRRQTLVLTDALRSPGYGALIWHIASRADRFALAYNVALAAYRAEAGIKTATRPMPDLQVNAERMELPFWLDDLVAGTRTRAMAVRRQNVWTLAARAEVRFDPSIGALAAAEALNAALDEARLRLSPRALTLTMFLRLLLADQFVHGIGGGRYDQVCDRVIESFFAIPAPAFSVTTATLYSPMAGQRSAICLPCLKTEGHRLRHQLPGGRKRRYLESIAAAPRHSAQRRVSYMEMHQDLATVFDHSEQVHAWRERVAEADERLKADQQAFDRELFFAIQPRERLNTLIAHYQSAVG